MRRRQFLTTAAACGAALPLFSTRAPRAQPAPRLSSFDGVVKPFVARMTLDEKLGQMTQGELNQIKDDGDVERYFLGSVLAGGDADPPAGNGLVAWTDTIDRLIRRSLQTRLKIPILYGVDAVHGHSNVEGAVIFPHNVGLGCTRNAELVREICRITALETRATGAQWTFAPCVAISLDDRWGRAYEAFGESAELASELGAAAVQGLQEGGSHEGGGPGAPLSSPRSVLACAKHYVGDGGTSYEPRESGGRRTLLDQGDTRVDEAALRRIHLPPYVAAIEAGVGSIMVSYNSWNGAKVSGSRRLLTEILKQELGFEGFLISDYYAIGQIHPDFKTAVAQSVNAGMDMAMEPARYALFIGTLKELVTEGSVPIERIDDAVTRILRVKWAMGLMDPSRSQLADRSLHSSFGSAEHRAVARRAVRESLVLLKNERRALPIANNARIHVAGKSADDIGIQCGGWTVAWQGREGAVTAGTTLLAAIKARAVAAANVTYSADGSGGADADVAVVVVGELPYAEGVGDRADLALAEDDVALFERVAARGKPVVVIVLSGRPLILGGVLDRAAAVVAAWLPGTEGLGVADVLFGDHPPTGTLSYTWPRSMADVPINVGDAPYAPQFPFGFGLGI
jgi:beta-glucosidase